MKRRHNSSIYRSGLEDTNYEILKNAGVQFEYEPKDKRVKYTKPATNHSYLPDFVVRTSSGKLLLIETKGIWSYEDRLKHLLIRQQHPELDIRFVFSRSKSKISKGSTTTYRDICEGRGRGKFKQVCWSYADKTIPYEWLSE